MKKDRRRKGTRWMRRKIEKIRRHLMSHRDDLQAVDALETMILTLEVEQNPEMKKRAKIGEMPNKVRVWRRMDRRQETGPPS